MAKKKAKQKVPRGRPRRAISMVGKKLSWQSELGAMLIRLRTAKKWRAVDLAEESGIGRTTIYDIEAGVGDPSLETLLTLDGALDAQGEFVQFAIKAKRSAR